MIADSDQRPFHALLIGIDHYPRRLGSVGPVYPDLGGCLADVRRIERYLRDVVGIAGERIDRLVSPLPLDRDLEREPGAREPNRPDYESLVAALERLSSRSQRGDHALVYYAGHGGRVRTAIPEVKGTVGLDECLVPWNIADPAARYLRDVELEAWLERSERLGVFVTLIIDCCHSGGAVRWRLPTRGIEVVDRTARRSESGLASPGELAAVARRRLQARRHLQLPALRRFSPTGYALLAACRPGERTVETPTADGVAGGAFTGSLLRVLDDLPEEATYEDLLGAVTFEVRCRFPAQTPMLEGESGRRWMAGRHRPLPPGIQILGRGAAGHSVRMATGAVHGIAEGAVLVVERRAEPPVDLRLTTAGAVSSEARASSSQAAWSAIGDRRSLGPGDRATPVDLGPRVARVGVHVPEPTDRPIGVFELFERLREELSGGATWVCPVSRGSESLAVDHDGDQVVILDRRGRTLSWTGPALNGADRDSVSELARRLDHLGRWEFIRRLENRSPDAALTGRIELCLRKLPRSWRPGHRLDPTPDPGRSARDRLSVIVNEWMLLEITNRSAQELNVAVLDLRPDWSIVQAFPSWYGGRFQALDPGACHAVPLRASLPSGMDRGTDVLLILATSDPASHRWLEMPPVADLEAGSGRPAKLAAGRRGPPRPAEDDASDEAGSWIDDEGADGWVAERVEIEITRRAAGLPGARRRGPAGNR